MVVSCDVLEHVDNASRALDEIYRVLRRGGRFIGFVPLEGGIGPHAFFRLFARTIYQETKDHRHAYSRREMMNLMTEKFAVSSVGYSYHFLGGVLDALFFASFKFPYVGQRMQNFWRGPQNAFYRASSERESPTMIGKAAGLANRVAYWESRLLHRVPIGASGLHFCLEKQ